jgi:methionyl-tRNA formyltransferase
LLEVVDRLAAGTATEEPQDDRLATYAPKLTKEESPIDWTLGAREIHNRVRGLHPWPLASTHLAGGRVIVWRTRVLEGTTDARPGVVVEVTRDTFHVATGGGGVIAIDEMQPEDRRRMTTREFLAGRPTPVGTVLGPG